MQKQLFNRLKQQDELFSPLPPPPREQTKRCTDDNQKGSKVWNKLIELYLDTSQSNNLMTQMYNRIRMHVCEVAYAHQRLHLNFERPNCYIRLRNRLPPFKSTLSIEFIPRLLLLLLFRHTWPASLSTTATVSKSSASTDGHVPSK